MTMLEELERRINWYYRTFGRRPTTMYLSGDEWARFCSDVEDMIVIKVTNLRIAVQQSDVRVMDVKIELAE